MSGHTGAQKKAEAVALFGLVVEPALSFLEGQGVRSDARAVRLLMAIGYQESGLQARRQMPQGPARGLWQFEPIGVLGVLSHHATKRQARTLCGLHRLPANVGAVHAALAVNDQLAAGFARLLLYTDRGELPGDQWGGWEAYKRTWRPGKPHIGRWPMSWAVGWVCGIPDKGGNAPAITRAA